MSFYCNYCPFVVLDMKRCSSPKIVRQRKMKILLTASPDEGTEPQSNSIYSTDKMLPICRNNWAVWIGHATTERQATLELVTQYPTSPNIGALLDIESLVNKMTFVSSIDIQDHRNPIHCTAQLTDLTLGLGTGSFGQS